MNKLCLLPISLFLLNPGFAAEKALNPLNSEITFVAAKENAARDFAAIEIDPKLVEELKEEISGILQKSDDPQDELISDAYDGEMSTASDEASSKSYNQRSRQPAPQQDKKQGPNVRRYPTQAAKPPRAQADNAQADGRYAPADKQNVKPRPQQTPAAKMQRTNPNTVEADRHQDYNDDEMANAEFEQPIQQQKRPSAQMNRSQAQKRSAPVPAQKRVAQQNNSQNQMRGQNGSNQMNQMNGQTGSQNNQMMMVNTPVRPMTKDGYDIWIMGDVLLWQAVEENLTYVYTGNDINGTNGNRNLHTVDFDWDWGFRLGAGYNLPRDGWDLDLYWTHIRNTADGHQHSSPPEKLLFQVWGTSDTLLGGTPTESRARWRVHLDQVDLDLGRQFWVGKDLSIRPYVGARSAWIFQRYDVEFASATVEQEAKLTNRYWGFGFAVGFDTEWKLGWDISLYGEADWSILLGFHDIDQKGVQGGEDLENDVKIWSQDKSFRCGRAIMDLGMGLKWARTFSRDRFGLTLKAGYEYHLYFNQNQFILSGGSVNFELFNPVGGDLIYQGVIGSMQIDF